MIYDTGVDRPTTDVYGIQAGYTVGDLVFQTETEILALIRNVYRQAPDGFLEPEGRAAFAARVLESADAVKRSCVALFAQKNRRIAELMESAIQNGFRNGIQKTNAEIRDISEQRASEDTELEQAKGGQNFTAVAVGTLLQAEAVAIQDAMDQMLRTNAMIATGYGAGMTLYRAIDSFLLPNVSGGLTGKYTADGRRLAADSFAEGATRENAHRATLIGESAAARAAGLHYIQISSHISCCEKCRPWQNVILIDDVWNDGRPDGVYELLSRAIASGWAHWNCRCTRRVVIPGRESFRVETYPDDFIAGNYETEQEQRKLQRSVRRYKRAASAATDDATAAKAEMKVKEYQARLRGLMKDAREHGIIVYRQPFKEAKNWVTPLVDPYGVAKRA